MVHAPRVSPQAQSRAPTRAGPARALPAPAASLAAAGVAHKSKAELAEWGPPRPNRTGLPDRLKQGLESLSGYSLDNVRVYYNSPKPAQLHALAYAQGDDIHIAPGQTRHLPHETWHVVQQKQGRVKPTLQAKGVAINDDSGLEREADVMGALAASFVRRFARGAEVSHAPVRSQATLQQAVLQGHFDMAFIDDPSSKGKGEPILKVTGSRRSETEFGAHSTAYKLIEGAARMAIEHHTFELAWLNLSALWDETEVQLKIATRSVSLSEAQNAKVAKARMQFEALVASCEDGEYDHTVKGISNRVPVLQQMAEQVIQFRHLLPGTMITDAKGGVVSGLKPAETQGKVRYKDTKEIYELSAATNEGRGAAELLSAHQSDTELGDDAIDTSFFAIAMEEVFDIRAAEQLESESGEAYVGRLATQLALHIRTAVHSYALSSPDELVKSRKNEVSEAIEKWTFIVFQSINIGVNEDIFSQIIRNVNKNIKPYRISEHLWQNLKASLREDDPYHLTPNAEVISVSAPNASNKKSTSSNHSNSSSSASGRPAGAKRRRLSTISE